MDDITKTGREEERQITWHPMAVTRERREALLGQTAATIWLTGLSGSGKSQHNWQSF